MKYEVSVSLNSKFADKLSPVAKVSGDVTVDAAISDGLGNSPLAATLDAFIRALRAQGIKVVREDV
jgi:hypothetical protein